MRAWLTIVVLAFSMALVAPSCSSREPGPMCARYRRCCHDVLAHAGSKTTMDQNSRCREYEREEEEATCQLAFGRVMSDLANNGLPVPGTCR